MPEDQNIEYKENWRDEYLQWVAGFANAQGGTIFIGKDDSGKTVGLKEAKRLMDDLPNKFRDVLGVMPEVNLHEENGLNFIEIVTPPYSVAISYHGKYYYRSGSTRQELKGNALNDFLLKKSGKTWDVIEEPKASIDDIDQETVEKFLRDSRSAGRLPDDIDNLSLEELFEKLRVLENGKLTRAAVVLFGKRPERFYSNQKVRIGRFGVDDADLKFQDEIEGNLLHLLYETTDILNRKYFKNPVRFEGLLRIETGEYPAAAIREMLLNALVHRDYMGTSIQLRVYDNKISIWNEGGLPEGLSLEALKRQHPSRPRNPLIAEVCFKGGYIDAWGRGTLKIIQACRDAELPDPEILERDGGVSVTLFENRFNLEALKKLGLSERQLKAVSYVLENGSISNTEYKSINVVSDRTALRDLDDLVSKGFFQRKGEKKSSRYYTT